MILPHKGEVEVPFAGGSMIPSTKKFIPDLGSYSLNQTSISINSFRQVRREKK